MLHTSETLKFCLLQDNYHDDDDNNNDDGYCADDDGGNDANSNGDERLDVNFGLYGTYIMVL